MRTDFCQEMSPAHVEQALNRLPAAPTRARKAQALVVTPPAAREPPAGRGVGRAHGGRTICEHQVAVEMCPKGPGGCR